MTMHNPLKAALTLGAYKAICQAQKEPTDSVTMRRDVEAFEQSDILNDPASISLSDACTKARVVAGSARNELQPVAA